MYSFLCISHEGLAQLKADFKADTLSFCPPYTVSFKDASTGRITSRRWEFGQGGVSNNNNPFPSATYVQAGSYTVKLVVSDGVRSDSIIKTAYIKAFRGPQTDFTTIESPNGCAPLSLSFRDGTVIGDSPIKTYTWIFGDGFRDTIQHPIHTYSFDGKYTVDLLVIDTNGCVSTIKKSSFVHSIKGPTARFTTSPAPNSCQPPHTVNFINQSSGLGILTYQWDLGNGVTSTLSNPSETYQAGAFDIKLIATDSAGCTDTLVKSRYVTVGAAKADFTMVDTFCLSDTNFFYFTNLSIGANSFYWDFGDGRTSRSRNPVHRYFQTGVFDVKLVIGQGTPCSDSIIKQVVVIQPRATFTTDINYWCKDTSINLTPGGTYASEAKYGSWDLMNHPPRKPNYVPPKYAPIKAQKGVGTHVDTLVVYYPKWGSCSSRVVKPTIRVWRPMGVPVFTPKEGCVPLNVQFAASILPTDSLQNNGLWSFDDGTTAATRNTSKLYNKEGTYTFTYTVSHKRGCKYEYGPYVIKTGTKPNADFKIDSTEFCAGADVQIVNTSTDSNKITGYHWKLDVQRGFPTSNKRHPLTNFSDTGYKTVFLRVDYNGCKDSITKTNFVKVLGPIGLMNVSMDCDKPFERVFSPQNWIGVQRFKYEFGDGVGADSSNQTATYSYSSRGDYSPVVTLYNDTNGCEFPVTTDVKIRDIKLRSTIDSNITCFPYMFNFDTRQSQDVEHGLMYAYGLRTTYLDSAFHLFSMFSLAKGRSVPMLVGFDVNGCTDTNRHIVKTYSPEVIISSNVDSGCGSLAVQLIDSSVSDTTLIWRQWSHLVLGNSNQKNAQYLLQSPGTHKIELIVRDTIGCETKGEKLIKVFKPLPRIVVDTQLCKGDSVWFMNAGSKPLEVHQWSFGDSLFGSGDNPGIIYQKAGRKSIVLQVTEQHGCDSILSKPLWVDVQEVNRPQVVSLPKDTTCYPANIDFKILNPDSSVQFNYWRFDSADAYIRLVGPTAFYNYSEPGVYGVDIKVETTYGCIDSFRLDTMVRISGPYARFQIEDTICIRTPSSVKLTDVSGVYEFRMDFGDGVVDTVPGYDSLIHHEYSKVGFHPLYLIFTDSLGNCVKSWSDSVYIQEIEAEIQVLDSVGCPPFQLQASAAATPANQYRWYMDNQFLENSTQLTRTLSSPGKRLIVLNPVNTNTGCEDSDTMEIVVHPEPNLSSNSNGVFCYEDSLEVILAGAKTYQWLPRMYLSSASNDTVRIMPEEDMNYLVIGSNDQGCKDSLDLEFKVVRPPYVYQLGDTTLYAGQILQLDYPYQSDFEYSWSPSVNLSCYDCPDPEIEAKRDITYTLTIQDKYGCFRVDTNLVIDVDDDYILLIPNAFTPNYDGLNESFKFVAKGFRELEYFGIFNRWGEEVYTFTGLDDEWDGMYKGEYWQGNSKLVYRGRFIKHDGEPVDVSGFIVLLR